MRGVQCGLIALALTCLTAAQAFAHALQPGYLEIISVAEDAAHVFWRKPDVRGRPMPIEVVLPENCAPRTGAAPVSDGLAWVSSWAANCPGGLAGGEVMIEGLEKTQTEVLVRYETPSDAVQSVRLTPDRTAFVVTAEPGRLDVIRTYLPLGIDHILSGVDHLLFVFALLLLIPDRWRLFGAITAFTVAHSITMAAATFAWVTLPGPPVEAAIALSIMFLASELLQRDETSPRTSELLQRDETSPRTSERYPWTVSFSFGLLHGFGFAGALREIGLPQVEVPLALFSFNLGVEVGQLLFVVTVLACGIVLRIIRPGVLASLRAPKSVSAATSAYLIGGISAYWFIERVAGFYS